MLLVVLHGLATFNALLPGFRLATAGEKRSLQRAFGATGAGLAVQREKVSIRRTRREGCQQGMRSEHAAQSASAAASAVAGWVASRVHLGGGGAPRAETRVRGERCTAHRPNVYRNEKG